MESPEGGAGAGVCWVGGDMNHRSPILVGIVDMCSFWRLPSRWGLVVGTEEDVWLEQEASCSVAENLSAK